ncbi:uncharacterized protein [Hetaerina americana]|uniref:uncharacterized protein n=1 Tax=Hetaerina americana TaxID=62018 RepID=UPI003A7F359C
MYFSTMKTGSIGFLLIILMQSCHCEEDILQEDAAIDAFPTQLMTREKDYKLYGMAHEKVRTTMDNDKNCYERKEKTIPLKYHDDWNPDEKTLSTEIPVEYVIVRNSKESCSYEKECVKFIQSMRKRTHHKACEIVDNFYVGGDGYVYEGRGWDIAPYWELKGLRRKAITVQFLGDYTKTIPPPRVMEAFRSTLQIGVWLGKVSRKHKITSIREIYNNGTNLGEKLDEHLLGWCNWVNATFISSLWDYTIPRRLTFVFRSQWNASEPLKELIPRSQPVNYIMASDGGEGCFDRSKCTSWMKRAQQEQNAQYGDLLHNFYIGEEGEVYEGRGWDVAPHWELPGIKSGLLSVKLIGSSEEAINSLKLLVYTGVWLGRISPGYELFSLRQVYGDESLTGETLYRLATSWSPRLGNGSSINKKDPGEPHTLPFISASHWRPSFPYREGDRIEVPVEYVIVYDGDDRCFTRRECTAWIKREEEKYNSIYRGLPDNFYIGEDGSIYEGRGWTKTAQWHSLFPGVSFIMVRFMGSFEKDAPTWLALAAFNTLLETGIDSRKLLRSHKLITLRQTHSGVATPPNRLDSILKEMKSWSNNSLDINLIVPLDRWAISHPSHYPNLTHPIKYVVVGSVGNRCFTENSCRNQMINRYGLNVETINKISSNFYIGENGWIYEGRGWEGASQLNIKENDRNFLFVMFLGSFEKAFPSSIATYEFNHLMGLGVNSGKLVPDYKIVSIRQIFHDIKSPSDMLSEGIKSWHRWSDSVPYSSGEDHSPTGDSIYIPRRNLEVVSWAPPSRLNQIHHVFVLNVGHRCFSRDECTAVIRAEQNKNLTRSHSDWFVTDNFYVGEDGHVYEGRGWNESPARTWVPQRGNVITVAFLGDFEEDLPSPKAVFAFKYLMKMGMYLEYIGSSYTLESMKTSCANISFLGSALDQEIKSWENWRPFSFIPRVSCS